MRKNDHTIEAEALSALKRVLDTYTETPLGAVLTTDSAKTFEFFRAINAATIFLAGVEARLSADRKIESFDDAMASPTRGPETGLWIYTIGGACPMQADGTMDGNPFYFRARHGEWHLTVSKPGTDPVGAEQQDVIDEFDGPDPENGYMSCEEAAKIITDCWGTMKLKSIERRSANNA